MTVLGNFTANWTNILAFAAADYITGLASPAFSTLGVAGIYISDGVNFALKSAINNTSPLKNIIGGTLSSLLSGGTPNTSVGG